MSTMAVKIELNRRLFLDLAMNAPNGTTTRCLNYLFLSKINDGSIYNLVIAQLVERETVVRRADISRSLVQFRLARIFDFCIFLKYQLILLFLIILLYILFIF